MVGGRRAIVGAMVLVMVIGPHGAWLRAAAAAAAPGAGFGVPRNDSLAQARQARLEAVHPVLPTPADMRALADAALKRTDPVDFDPAVKAKALGGGIEPIFNYVRDAIRYEPYPGVLRGATGAYVSRAANAADRSLLLAAMLKAAGVQTRFAVGKLDAANAQALLERTFAAPAPAPAAAAPAPTPAPAEAKPAADLLARVRARATRDYATVMAAVGDALPAATSVTPRETLLEEIATDHVWVQARQGDAWVDLDPSFADAKPGKAYAAAARTPDALPPEMHQRVTLRVVTETLTADGKLAEDTNVELTEPAATLVMKPVFVLHAQKSGFGALGGTIKGETKDQYAPTFWVNGIATPGKHVAFADPAAGADGTAKAGGGGGLGGLAGALDALDSKPAPATPAAGPRLVAEFLDVIVTAPGRPASTSRRTLLDRAGAAWRAAAAHDPAALRPFDRDDNGPVAANALHNVIVTTGRHDLATYARNVVGSFTLDAKGGDANTWSGPPEPPQDMDPQRGLALALLPLATMNYGATLLADETFLPALNDNDGSTRLYRDSPRVTLVSSSVVQKDGRAAVYTTLDWRRDVLRGVAREPSGARTVAEGKLWYGLLEGALEHEWVAQQLVGEVTKLESTTAANDDASRDASVLTASKKPDAIGLKPDPAAEAAAAVAAGEVLVVPAAAVGAPSSGWWAIAPTGDTRAVWSVGHVINGGNLPPNIPKNAGGPGVNYVDPATGRGVSRKGGGGGELGEYAATIEINLPFGYVWVGTGKQLAAIIIAGATVLGAIGGGVYAAAN